MTKCEALVAVSARCPLQKKEGGCFKVVLQP
jgi:hypothetical protein